MTVPTSPQDSQTPPDDDTRRRTWNCDLANPRYEGRTLIGEQDAPDGWQVPA